MRLKHIMRHGLSSLRYKLDPVKETRALGVQMGEGCRLVGKIGWGSEPYLIRIGDRVSITSSNFITHDGGVWVFREEQPEIDLFGSIVIGSNVFIGLGCIVMPGTLIGDNVVVGAGSVVRGQLESNSVYAGTPVRRIKCLSEYLKSSMERATFSNKLSPREKKVFLTEKFKL